MGDKNAPKRNQTGYFHFLNAHREQIKSENPGIGVADIARKGGEMWKACEDRTEWEEKAKEDKVRYEKEMAEYKEKLAERGEDPETPPKKKKSSSKSPASSKPKPKSTPSKTDNAKFKSAEYIEDDFSSSDDDDGDKKPKATAKSDSDDYD